MSLPFSRAAYLRPITIERWSRDELRRWADDAADAGVTSLITKLDVISPELRGILESTDIEIVGSFSCYSDHRHPGMIPGGIRPVGPDGAPLAPIEWYTGLVPGDPRFDAVLAEELRVQTRDAEVLWVLLDFLRWPGHWETESRHGAHPRPASFDEGTVSRFAAFLDVPSISSAEVLQHPDEWAAFRVSLITSLAARFAAVLHDAGVGAGAFLVPVSHNTRRADYGQDAAALAEHVELFCAMDYQQMTGHDVTNTLTLADETRRLTNRPVVTMIQTTAAAEYAGGWDWGPPVDPGDLESRARVLATAVDAGQLAGTCFFPGEAPLPRSVTLPYSPSEGPKR